MRNQWWRQAGFRNKPDLVVLAVGIVIIGMIGYLIFPNFFQSINSLINPAVTATSLNDVNLPSTYNGNILNSSDNSSQILPKVSNSFNNGSGNNEITTGYWILFVSNGTFQQLPVNAQDYTFVQGLIARDSKGTATITVFLVENGQIHKYFVSNEVYSVISNMASIDTRASNKSTLSKPTTIPPNTISETLTISNPSTTGFTVGLSPALNGLTISNFTLVDSSGNPVALTGATTANGGATYVITTALSAGQTYTLTVADVGYAFGAAQNVVVPK